jgi:hypothetical protein
MIALLTATIDKRRAEPCLASWAKHARGQVPQVVVKNGSRSRGYLGVVPAFAKAMELCRARHTSDLIACFHDDLVILETWWDQRVSQVFADYPDVGLIGFAGGSGLGSDALYQEPYAPEQLAFSGYRSNQVDAEAHGARSLISEPVAAVDNFALIGRKAFWDGLSREAARVQTRPVNETRRGLQGGFVVAPSHWDRAAAPWTFLEQGGWMNHFYGPALSCLARRAGWQVFYVPIRCRHLGGQTTSDPGYQQWAEHVVAGGDRGFWEAAHRIGYLTFKDVLPLRVGAGGSAAAHG